MSLLCAGVCGCAPVGARCGIYVVATWRRCLVLGRGRLRVVWPQARRSCTRLASWRCQPSCVAQVGGCLCMHQRSAAGVHSGGVKGARAVCVRLGCVADVRPLRGKRRPFVPVSEPCACGWRGRENLCGCVVDAWLALRSFERAAERGPSVMIGRSTAGAPSLGNKHWRMVPVSRQSAGGGLCTGEHSNACFAIEEEARLARCYPGFGHSKVWRYLCLVFQHF